MPLHRPPATRCMRGGSRRGNRRAPGAAAPRGGARRPRAPRPPRPRARRRRARRPRARPPRPPARPAPAPSRGAAAPGARAAPAGRRRRPPRAPRSAPRRGPARAAAGGAQARAGAHCLCEAASARSLNAPCSGAAGGAALTGRRRHAASGTCSPRHCWLAACPLLSHCCLLPEGHARPRAPHRRGVEQRARWGAPLPRRPGSGHPRAARPHLLALHPGLHPGQLLGLLRVHLQQRGVKAAHRPLRGHLRRGAAAPRPRVRAGGRGAGRPAARAGRTCRPCRAAHASSAAARCGGVGVRTPRGAALCASSSLLSASPSLSARRRAGDAGAMHRAGCEPGGRRAQARGAMMLKLASAPLSLSLSPARRPDGALQA